MKDGDIKFVSGVKEQSWSIPRILVSLLIFGGLLSCGIRAQVLLKADQKPAEIQDVALDEKLNGQVDPSLTFLDENGQTVALKDYFGKGRPDRKSVV